MNDLHESVAVTSSKVTAFLNSIITSTGLKLGFDISESERAAATAPAPPVLTVQFTGPDTSFLTARHGELLHSLEHLAAQVLRLSPEEHDRISFDADNFKQNRELELRSFADHAIESVRTNGRPYCVSSNELPRAPDAASAAQRVRTSHCVFWRKSPPIRDPLSGRPISRRRPVQLPQAAGCSERGRARTRNPQELPQPLDGISMSAEKKRRRP